MIAVNVIVLAVVALLTWWLTGKDKNISGQSMRDQHLWRAIRCILVDFLLALLLWFPSWLTLFIIPIPVALLLRSSVSEIFAHGFMGFLDPALHDSREIDLKKAQRHQDAIAHLIHHGRKDEAIQLCEELKKSGEVDMATIEAALGFLGVKPEHAPVIKPLTEAARLRAQGDFAGAEQRLKALLVKNPADADAAMLLMRLYAQNFRQPGKALEILKALEKQKHVAAAHIEFARRSIDGWSRESPAKNTATAPAPPESIDEMLAQGFFGSAIELLEQQVKEQPGSFDLQLRLAEVQAVHCANFHRAEKIIRRLAADARYTPAQAALATGKLKEWQEMRLQRK